MASVDFLQCQQRASEQIYQGSQAPARLDGLLDALRQVAIDADDTIEQHPGDRSLIDCGPGCSTCCVVNVSTLLPEGIAIARHIRSQGAVVEKAAVDRLEALWREVRGIDDDDRLYMRRPCAFIDESGSCSIYPLRPLLCRSVTSTDAQTCRDALAGKTFGEETAIMMHQFQQNLYETLFTGVADGLERSGLDGRSFQLSGLTRYLLRHPEAEAAWLDGQRLTWQDIY